MNKIGFGSQEFFYGEEKSQIEEYIDRVDFDQYPGKDFWHYAREKLSERF